MAIQLPEGRSLSNEVLEALRLRALRGRELGFTEAQLAELLGVTRETVSRWWTAYSREGLEALPQARTGRPLGSGRLLSDEEARWIQHRLDHHVPEDLGIPAPVWTRAAVATLIEQELGLTLAIRTVGQYLRRWGYTPQQPARHARQQDPEEVARWLDETFPALLERVAAENGVLYWCDETGIGIDDFHGRGYARRGQTPEQTVAGTHTRVNAVSAISAQGAAQFFTFQGSLDGAVFIAFLQQVLSGTSQKVFVVLDRLTVHESAEVAAWVAKQQGRLELIPLPRYAPERNPVEYLNQDAKAEVHAEGLPESKEQLQAQVNAFLGKLAYWKERIKSYFCHPKVQYAAASPM